MSETPDWVKRMRARGRTVTDAKAGGCPPVDAFVAPPSTARERIRRSVLECLRDHPDIRAVNDKGTPIDAWLHEPASVCIVTIDFDPPSHDE